MLKMVLFSFLTMASSFGASISLTMEGSLTMTFESSEWGAFYERDSHAFVDEFSFIGQINGEGENVEINLSKPLEIAGLQMNLVDDETVGFGDPGFFGAPVEDAAYISAKFRYQSQEDGSKKISKILLLPSDIQTYFPELITGVGYKAFRANGVNSNLFTPTHEIKTDYVDIYESFCVLEKKDDETELFNCFFDFELSMTATTL